MKEGIPKDWQRVLKDELEKDYFKKLEVFIENAYKTSTCFPKKEQIFNALKLCAFKSVKVIIIGQDPYHDVNQANGLCFSVNDGIKHPPSLVNIFKELKMDIGKEIPVSGNLEHWAKQGVLLLNTILTVEAHKAGSHKNKGWENLTDSIIKNISNSKEHIIFLLWGGFAKSKAKLIDKKKHDILTSGHPSPLSANRGYWFGNKHFSQTNTLLKNQSKDEIKW